MKIDNLGIVYINTSSNSITINFMDSCNKMLCGTTVPAIKHKDDGELSDEAIASISRLVNLVKQHGIEHVKVHFKGRNKGCSEVVRELKQSGMQVDMIKDLNPIPHNACRPLRKNNRQGG